MTAKDASHPAPSEDRLFTDWSSIGSGSPPIIPPTQSVPVGDTLTTPGIEGIHDTDQTALQPSQSISEEPYMVPRIVQFKKIFLPPQMFANSLREDQMCLVKGE